LHARRRLQRRNELWELVARLVRERLIARAQADGALTTLVEQVMQGTLDPHSGASRILDDPKNLRRWLLGEEAG
jgi:putative protein kinase ArgK-like GTPase of G3E family